MLLYKFKSLANWDHARDLLEGNRLYCPQYGQLNDPFEGQLRHFRAYPERSLFAAATGITGSLTTIDLSELPNLCADVIDRNRICSLSAAASDVRMWSLYADSHRGIAVEIEKKPDDQWVQVNYSADLSSAERALGAAEVDEFEVRRILSSKTQHWEYEQEWRIFSDSEHFQCADRIKRVILGPRCTEDHADRLRAIAPGISVVKAHLSHSAAEVVMPLREAPPLPILRRRIEEPRSPG